MTPPALGPAIPILGVASVTAALDFYKQVLGFKVIWRWSPDAGFDAVTPTFACIEGGEATLFLSAADDAPRGAALFFELPYADDIDAFAACLPATIPITAPLGDRPWGSREITIADPDGHRLRLSCPASRRCPA